MSLVWDLEGLVHCIASHQIDSRLPLCSTVCAACAPEAVKVGHGLGIGLLGKLAAP